MNVNQKHKNAIFITKNPKKKNQPKFSYYNKRKKLKEKSGKVKKKEKLSMGPKNYGL